MIIWDCGEPGAPEIDHVSETSEIDHVSETSSEELAALNPDIDR